MKKPIMLLYAIFLFLFTFFSYAFVDPNLFYLKKLYSDFAFSNRLLTAIFYTSSIIVFFIFYGLFIWLIIKKRLSLKDVLILISITIGILFFSYPAMLSYDIFNYIATSKVLFFYHENPYVVMPIEFMRDSLLKFTHAANKIALYGPVWVSLTGIPYFLGHGNFIINLFALKLLSGVFYLGATLLIWKVSRNITFLTLFALNPLIVIETLVGGHNDIVMIFLVIFSFFLIMRKKILLGVLSFILSIFIKYTTVLLVPIFIFILWKIIRKKEINYEKIFYHSSLLMYIGFLLSPIREEIYPWYAIWFLPFVFLIPKQKILLYTSVAFSFGLMFRYVPFMLLGFYTSPTPLIKTSVTFAPVCLVLFYFLVKKLWVKISSQ